MIISWKSDALSFHLHTVKTGQANSIAAASFCVCACYFSCFEVESTEWEKVLS